mmetsp:Transcript_8291/g.10057  ORF Transcript_8291/g.10057 Transcript_8291/m.10057 type:complete len:316 (+) Transcript_8291:679-1626(+)
MVHLDRENLTSARIGSSVGRHEDNFLVGLDEALLNAASKHITNTLDLVDARDGHAHGRSLVAARRRAHVVEAVVEGVDVNLLLVGHKHVLSGPPAHVLRLLVEVVAHPAGDGEDRNGVLDEVLLPADLDKHVLHLSADLVVPRLLVAGNIGVHLVDANDELLDAKKVDEARMLTRLALHLTSLVVALLDGSGEVTIGRHHEEGDVSLGGAGNHILDKVTVTGGVNNGVMPLLSEELLGGARDRHTTLTLLLLAVHVEGEGERRLTKAVSLGLELLHLTLGNTAEFEEKAASGGRLARVDVATDNNRHVVLLSHVC